MTAESPVAAPVPDPVPAVPTVAGAAPREPAAPAPSGASGSRGLRAHIDALTGLRAVAALAVMTSHAAFWTGHYTDDLPGYLSARLEVGVAFFFVLSGYLLCRPWLRAALSRSSGSGETAAATHSPSLKGYVSHRVRRILPAYWIVVVAVYVVYLFTDSGPTGRGWTGLLRNLTLTQIYGYGHLHDGLTQMWSLAVEASFYAVLPLIGWFLVSVACRRRRRPIAVAGSLLVLAAVSPIWMVVTHRDTGMDLTARLWLPGFLWWFIGGMALALFVATIGERMRINAPLMYVLSAASFAVTLSPAAGEPTIVPTDLGAALFKSTMYLLCSVFLVAGLTAGGRAGGAAPRHRLFAARPLVWLGEISYEIFLVHVVILEFVCRALGYGTFQGSMAIALALTFVIAVPIAWALHRGLRRVHAS